MQIYSCCQSPIGLRRRDRHRAPDEKEDAVAELHDRHRTTPPLPATPPTSSSAWASSGFQRAQVQRWSSEQTAGRADLAKGPHRRPLVTDAASAWSTRAAGHRSTSWSRAGRRCSVDRPGLRARRGPAAPRRLGDLAEQAHGARSTAEPASAIDCRVASGAPPAGPEADRGQVVTAARCVPRRAYGRARRRQRRRRAGWSGLPPGRRARAGRGRPAAPARPPAAPARDRPPARARRRPGPCSRAGHVARSARRARSTRCRRRPARPCSTSSR